jgi:hypothetical protein
MKRYKLYYIDDFSDKYPAFSKESVDGEWVKWEDVREYMLKTDKLLTGLRSSIHDFYNINFNELIDALVDLPTINEDIQTPKPD